MGSDSSLGPAPTGNQVAMVGLGSIGISFAALYLRFGTGVVKVFDTRPDLQEHLESILPGYLGAHDGSLSLGELQSKGRLVLCDTLEQVCANSDIIQEQGPENVSFKRTIWSKIEKHAPQNAQFWSSTSGIAASVQHSEMVDRSRLLVVHPFNPPHIMPLIEIVPSPETNPAAVEFAQAYFNKLGSGHRPIVINKELPGFVGNRLAYVLFREAAYLVKNDVVSVEDLDAVIQASLGPRFAVQGPFKAYHMGGGIRGIRGFLGNLRNTIQDVWNSYQSIDFGKEEEGSSWEEKIIQQTESAYGTPTTEQFNSRDQQLRRVIGAQNLEPHQEPHV